MYLPSIPVTFLFVRFFFSIKNYVFIVRIFTAYVHIRTKQTVTYRTKVFRKHFCKSVQLYFEILLFERNIYQYVAVYLLQKQTYKNAEEKAHTFSRTSKNLKKRTKIEYWVNSPKVTKFFF